MIRNRLFCGAVIFAMALLLAGCSSKSSTHQQLVNITQLVIEGTESRSAVRDFLKELPEKETVKYSAAQFSGQNPTRSAVEHVFNAVDQVYLGTSSDSEQIAKSAAVGMCSTSLSTGYITDLELYKSLYSSADWSTLDERCADDVRIAIESGGVATLLKG